MEKCSGEAFSEKDESVRKWRSALQEAVGLAGWELKSTFNGHEAKLIQEIVEEISRKLLCNDMNIDGRLVGMETRVNEVFLSLKTDIDDVRMIGIKGIGGGGKTTLARAVFDKIYISFDGSSFVENVKGVCKGSSKGMRSLQKQVLLDVFKEKEIYVSGVSNGKNNLKNMLRSRKVLVVLDDVDCLDQLEALAGEPNWFKPGSRIIITTRDEHVLQTHQVNFIHDVNLLFEEEAICLFSRYAFRKDIPVQGYQELSKRFIAYAAGLPLTLKVLGSFLYGKTVDEWMDTLERLKTIPLKETLEILKLSYDSLEDDYKEIFLDIACMMKNWKKDKAIRALESCGFHAKIGLRVLEQKSLITFRVDPYGIGWVLGMHDHIEEMGKNIVRHLHPNEPYKHSRLLIEEEIEDILDKNQGTEATRCIHLGNSRLHPATIMNGVRKMTRLRVLYVQDRREYDHDFIHKDWESYVSSQYLPHSLQYLAWNGYPFACLPKFFQENNVMKFEMPDNNTEELWVGEERKVLDKLASDSKLRFLYLESTPKLKYLDLSASTMGFVYLGRSPNLELLSLRNCYDLEELYLPVGSVKLKSINMYCHPNLYRLSLCETLNLEKLDIEDCDNLVELHVPTKLKSISPRASGLRTLDLALVQHLQEIIIKECEDLVELIIPIKSLELKSLQLNGSKLRTLDLMREPNLEKLCLNECDDLVELYMPVESLKLKTLVIYDSKVTIDISRTPNLEILELFNHGHFVELQMQAVSSLRWLRKLVLWGSFAEVPKDLQLLEFLEKLTLSSNGTKDLRSIFMLKHVKVLKLIGSCLEELPEDIGILESLEEILLSSKMIKHLPNSICTLKQLKVLCIQDCDLLEQLPENIGRLESFRGVNFVSYND